MYFCLRLGVRGLNSAGIHSSMETGSLPDLLVPGSGQMLLEQHSKERGEKKPHLVILLPGSIRRFSPTCQLCELLKKCQFFLEKQKYLSSYTVKWKTVMALLPLLCSVLLPWLCMCKGSSVKKISLLLLAQGDLILNIILIKNGIN